MMVSKHVKDLDLKAFHNQQASSWSCIPVSKHVKDLDLKAFHNDYRGGEVDSEGVKARQRS